MHQFTKFKLDDNEGECREKRGRLQGWSGGAKGAWHSGRRDQGSWMKDKGAPDALGEGQQGPVAIIGVPLWDKEGRRALESLQARRRTSAKGAWALGRNVTSWGHDAEGGPDALGEGTVRSYFDSQSTKFSINQVSTRTSGLLRQARANVCPRPQ